MSNLFKSESKVKLVEERVVPADADRDRRAFKLVTFANMQTYERMTFITDVNEQIAPLYTEGTLLLNCGEYKGRTSFQFDSFVKE
jgi:hypothetical protein